MHLFSLFNSCAVLFNHKEHKACLPAGRDYAKEPQRITDSTDLTDLTLKAPRILTICKGRKEALE
jgi:hypothetical protein